MGEVINYDNGKTDEELINYATKKIGATELSSFNLSDLLADVDATLISKINSENLYELIGYYYYTNNNIISNRMSKFKENFNNNIYKAVQKRFSGIVNQTIIARILTASQENIYKANSEKYNLIMATAFDNYFKKY